MSKVPRGHHRSTRVHKDSRVIKVHRVPLVQMEPQETPVVRVPRDSRALSVFRAHVEPADPWEK